MIHAEFLESYIHFSLMYTTDHISPLLQIKHLMNKDVKTIMPFKRATGTKPSLSHLCMAFFPRVVQKVTTHVAKKSLNMLHQAQKSFCSIFVGI